MVTVGALSTPKSDHELPEPFRTHLGLRGCNALLASYEEGFQSAPPLAPRGASRKRAHEQVVNDLREAMSDYRREAPDNVELAVAPDNQSAIRVLPGLSSGEARLPRGDGWNRHRSSIKPQLAFDYLEENAIQNNEVQENSRQLFNFIIIRPDDDFSVPLELSWIIEQIDSKGSVEARWIGEPWRPHEPDDLESTQEPNSIQVEVDIKPRG